MGLLMSIIKSRNNQHLFVVCQTNEQNINLVFFSFQAVSEKEMLLSFLSFLQSLEDPVVLFFYYMDALLPTILAKLNKFKLFGKIYNAER